MQTQTPLPAVASLPEKAAPIVPLSRSKNYPEANRTMATLVLLADSLVAVFALLVAWWLRFETPIASLGVPLTEGLSVWNYSGHMILGATLMIVIMVNFRAYDPSYLLTGKGDIRLVFRCTVIWLISFLGLWLTLKIQPSISRIYCVAAAGCIFFFLATWRYFLTRYLLPTRSSSVRRKIFLIGWSSGMEQIVNATTGSNSKLYDIRGIFLPKQGSTDSSVKGIPQVNGFSTLRRQLEENPPDGVLAADRDLDGDQLAEIASICEREMIDFEMLPSCFPSLVSGLNMKRVFGVPVLGVTKLPLHSNINLYLKRAMDIVGAVIGLILTAPILAIFALLIKRESRGPVFYKQTRVGSNGKPFEIYKLRSMRTDAEVDNKPGWTVADDPRCLKIGKFMRKWNIDELPQLWNVLKGEMSLVGPRPERPELIANFKNEILHYNARHSVKPGITGWAQVNGLRGDTDLTERIRHDLHYIENWNLLFDITIIIRTFLTNKGAC